MTDLFEKADPDSHDIVIERIVFQNAGSLHLLSLKTGAVDAVAVTIPTDRVRMRPEFVTVSPTKGAFGLSPGGDCTVLA